MSDAESGSKGSSHVGKTCKDRWKSKVWGHATIPHSTTIKSRETAIRLKSAPQLPPSLNARTPVEAVFQGISSKRSFPSEVLLFQGL